MDSAAKGGVCLSPRSLGRLRRIQTKQEKGKAMGIMPSQQPCESKKVRIRRRPVSVSPPQMPYARGPKQAGKLWQRKMQSLALRLPKRRSRRDRSGVPMKRG